MKVGARPSTTVAVSSLGAPAAAETSRVGVDAAVPADDAVVEVPVPKAALSALTATATSSAAPAPTVSRPHAPWTGQSIALANAALAAAAGRSGAAAITAVVDHILNSRELKGSRLSCAVSLKGQLVVERGVDVAVNPCSNAKLVTAAFALSVLGPLHRFATELLRAPDGAVIVRGAFDPTLTTDDLVELARELKARGVVKVPRLVVDNSALAGGNVPRAFEKYGNEDWEYLARPEALSVNKNALKIVVKPGKNPGEPARVEVDNGAFSIRNRVTTTAPGATFKVGCDELDTAGVLERGPDGKAIVEVWGDVAADYSKGKQLVMKSPSPTESFIDRISFAFAQAGIAVSGPVVEAAAPAGSTPMLSHRSKPLGELLKDSLATSNAFDHEMFALAAAHKAQHAPGHKEHLPITLDGAARQLEAFLGAAVHGKGAMVNASGIGNENRLRAKDIVALLHKAGSEPRLAPLLQALATPGGKGTLKARMLDTAAEGTFHGKTGTGEGAAALSGVCGEVAMSLLVDETAAGRESARAALDALAIALSSLSKA